MKKGGKGGIGEEGWYCCVDVCLKCMWVSSVGEKEIVVLERVTNMRAYASK